jgi:hypothetical protein
MHNRDSQRNSRRHTDSGVWSSDVPLPTGYSLFRRLSLRCINDAIGGVCLIEATVDSRMEFVLSPVRAHPGTSQRDTPLCHSTIRNPSIQSSARCSKHRFCCAEIFNVTQNKDLLEFMKENFHLDCVRIIYHAR